MTLIATAEPIPVVGEVILASTSKDTALIIRVLGGVGCMAAETREPKQ